MYLITLLSTQKVYLITLPSTQKVYLITLRSTQKVFLISNWFPCRPCFSPLYSTSARQRALSSCSCSSHPFSAPWFTRWWLFTTRVTMTTAAATTTMAMTVLLQCSLKASFGWWRADKRMYNKRHHSPFAAWLWDRISVLSRFPKSQEWTVWATLLPNNRGSYLIATTHIHLCTYNYRNTSISLLIFW